MDEEELQENVEKQVEKSMKGSGLLFQSHPQFSINWKTTRPGAFEGEVVAFTNKCVEPSFDRLSVRHYQEGETDANDHTWKNDVWIVETIDQSTEYQWEEEVHTSRDEAIERVAEIMIDVEKNRQ